MPVAPKPAVPLTFSRFNRLKKSQDGQPLVDRIITLVNADLSSPKVRDAQRCSPKVGSFMSIAHNAPGMSPEETLELDTRFRAAGWPDIQVVFWQERVSVALSERPNQFTNAPSAYNGKPLLALVESRRKRAA